MAGIKINLTTPNAAAHQPVDPAGSARGLAELRNNPAAAHAAYPAPPLEHRAASGTVGAPAPRKARAKRSGKQSAVLVRMPLPLRAMLDHVSRTTGLSRNALMCVALSFYILKMNTPI